jgi:hypothetical protein
MKRDSACAKLLRWNVFVALATTVILVAWSAAAFAGWVALYDDPANGDDIPCAMALDRDANVYVTGYVIVSANLVEDIVTVKYAPNGIFQWAAFYNGPANMGDEAVAMAVDRRGNVYVTGWSEGGSSTVDFVTIKYDTLGNQQWVTRYNDPRSANSYPAAIAVDSSGNVYVTGSSDSKETINSTTLVTIKYDTYGNTQWVRRYDGPAKGNLGRAIGLDRGGNVFVAGASSGTSSGYDFLTMKYDTAGNQKWVRRYNGPGNADDAVTAMAVDSSGNVYVTGDSIGASSNRDFATIKYDTNGRRQWVKRYNGPSDLDDYPTAITVDTSANACVTGCSNGSASSWDYATIKYTAEGQAQWVRRYNGSGSLADASNAIAVDGSSNVYVTGGSRAGASDSDFATLKYDAVGRRRWVKGYNGPGNGWDAAQSIAVDSSGNVFVAGGSCMQGASGCDFAIIKYDANTIHSFPGGVNGGSESTPSQSGSHLDW